MPNDSPTFNVVLPEKTMGTSALMRPMLVVTRYGMWLIYVRHSDEAAHVISAIGVTNDYTLDVSLSGNVLTLTFNKNMHSGYRLIVLD